MFLLKTKTGHYVSNNTKKSIYTKNIKEAKIYHSKISAVRDRAVIEDIVTLEGESKKK